MATYIYDDTSGRMVDKATGAPMVSDEARATIPPLPMIMGFKPYACPITGKEIRTLGQHKDNLRRHDCVEAAELPSPTGGKIRNERFARKRGLKVSDEYKDAPCKPKTRKS